MANYLVVLFKDKKRKKIINKFLTLDNAQRFFDKCVSESKEVFFDKQVVNGDETLYEIGLVQVGKMNDGLVYLKDNHGRNIKVKMDEKNMSLIKVSPYKLEETLYDIQSKSKITVNQFMKNYLRGDGLKMISGLNNKVVIQEDEKINIFLLKNTNECQRFLSSLSQYFFTKKRKDCLIVNDTSIAQRKYLYEFLETRGYDKKFLYRKSTVLPQ